MVPGLLNATRHVISILWVICAMFLESARLTRL